MKELSLILFLFPLLLIAQDKRALTVEDLWAMKRINSFDVSTDGKMIVFAATSYSIEENKGNSDIYLVNSDGSNLKSLKNSDKNESSPLFVPGSNRISYLLDGQIWTCNPDGSGEEKLTDVYTKVTEYEWSPSGDKILFTSSVYSDCKTQECNKQKDEEKEASKVKASIFTELMYRHWDEWRNGKVSQLFLFDVKEKSFADVTSDGKFDIPPIALGSSNDYNFSPDENQIAFTMNIDLFISSSTNNDIFIYDLNKIGADEKSLNRSAVNPPVTEGKISQSNGNDNQPVYSPDGKYITFSSMKRAGFEADKQDLVLFDREKKTLTTLTDNFNLSVGEIIWSNDSKTLYFTAETETNNSIYKIDIQTAEIELLHKENTNTKIQLSEDGKTLFFLKQRSDLPDEIFSLSTDGKNILKQITFLNKDLLSQVEFEPLETFWCEGANGDKVQSILIKPPFFDPNKKYPMIFLIHGGPQGHWADDFHYRWDIQLFASKGYVVVAPNPRGSTGYGQKFTDEISLDWGGKVYTDLMNAYDYALKNYNFIDSRNTFAAGASYGGYMINWIEVHTDRFNALVNHDGVFNLESEYGTTEELWFPEWEFGGTPWQNRELYQKWSPHMYIQNAKTPMLIIHGANDFRVPEEQAFQLFTSLQKLGIESKLLYFPDESHWVTKSQNSVLWWNTVFDWFNEHKKREDL
ncbi:MAG: dipeptidyl aminopeptidase [Ignavibacteria bacterium GWA2_35_9]|nr:MAG: dipeptidyl aminopeptidase [Ignavibacteria bacterium GWA2_35_9]OGU50521.1 MAG: dipeptidyl aminopeptidase [Ignavibacteria bacterium GWC2_36_12]